MSGHLDDSVNMNWASYHVSRKSALLVAGIQRRRSWRTMLGMFVLLVALMGGMLACGGKASSGGGGGTSIPGTTSGTYTVTVTGTSGVITATGVVTFNVQ